jgi:Fibronectin type III domain
VQRSNDGVNNWTTRATLAKNTPSYTDTGSTGTTYYYRIQTLDSGGNVVATSSVVTESTRLSTVSGLAFTNQASNQLAFKWNAVTNATGYRVERSLDNSSFSTISSNVSTTNYADNNVSSGTTYCYRVTALKSGLTESAAPSSVISTAPPASAAGSAPSGVASSSKSSNGKTANLFSVPSDSKSVVKKTVRKFQEETHTDKLSKRQRAAVESVLANWNFDRSDRALSKALLKSLSHVKSNQAGISLLPGKHA